MSKNDSSLPPRNADGIGRFGYQPIEQRGHQPIAAVPIFGKDTVAGGYQPTASQTGSPPATPPSQGSSAKK